MGLMAVKPAGGAVQAEEGGGNEQKPGECPDRPRNLGIARRTHGKAPLHDRDRVEEIAERTAVKGERGGHGWRSL